MYLLVGGAVVLVAQYEHGQLGRVLILHAAHIVNESLALLEAHPARNGQKDRQPLQAQRMRTEQFAREQSNVRLGYVVNEEEALSRADGLASRLHVLLLARRIDERHHTFVRVRTRTHTPAC